MRLNGRVSEHVFLASHKEQEDQLLSLGLKPRLISADFVINNFCYTLVLSNFLYDQYQEAPLDSPLIPQLLNLGKATTGLDREFDFRERFI